MTRAARLILNLLTLVLPISLAVLGLLWSFRYVWENAMANAPRIHYSLTVGNLERLGLSAYLRYRSDDVRRPVDPSDQSEVIFVVEPGDSVTQVASKLERAGLITDAALFRWVVQHAGADRNIEAGAFPLRPSMTMNEIATRLQQSRLASATVTVPEGWRVEQIAALLETRGVVSADAFLQAVREPSLSIEGREEFALLFDRPEGASVSLEGFLFPDTYAFALDSSADAIILTMLETWRLRVSDLLAEGAETGLTIYELVTLASIVEREAVLASEQPLIAGVYLNRLGIEMLLQADPTTQYAKGYSEALGTWWAPLAIADLSEVISPYNTYVSPGLPPGPICNPGLSAIEAAIRPAPSDYYYFLARGDTGEHVFARTFEEHLQNQARYGGR
jgi:UPF0755 protein